MSTADYTHELTSFEGHDILLINDLDLGNKSVTNDIENVVADIAKMEKIDPARYIILYCDSDNLWTGWDYNIKDFVPMVEENWQDAFYQYKQRHQKPHL